jgi:hypothetical protein
MLNRTQRRPTYTSAGAARFARRRLRKAGLPAGGYGFQAAERFREENRAAWQARRAAAASAPRRYEKPPAVKLGRAEQERFNRIVANAPIVRRGKQIIAQGEQRRAAPTRAWERRQYAAHLGFDFGAALHGDARLARDLGLSFTPDQIKKHPVRAGLTVASVLAPELVAARAGRLGELVAGSAGRGRTYVREARAFNKALEAERRAAMTEEDLAYERLQKRALAAIGLPLAGYMLFGPNYRSDTGWQPVSKAPGNRFGRYLWSHR